MKKFFTLKNILLCVAVFLGLLVFIFSFCAAFRVSAGEKWMEYQSVIWGSGRINYSDGSAEVLANANKLHALALPLIGAILILLATICLALMLFLGEKLLRDDMIRRIVIFVAGGLLVLGGIFTFFTVNALKDEFVRWYELKNFDEVILAWKAALLSTSVAQSCALPIVSGILAILGGGAAVCSQFVNSK